MIVFPEKTGVDMTEICYDKAEEGRAMKQKLQKKYDAVAHANGLRLDAKSGVISGKYAGYSVQIFAADTAQPYMLTVQFGVHRNAPALTKAECKEFAKAHEGVVSVSQSGNAVFVVMRVSSKEEKIQEEVKEILWESASYLRQQGFTACCQRCGKEEDTESFQIGNRLMQLCEKCSEEVQRELAAQVKQEEETKENLPGGIAGAFIGSLIGAACIVLIGQLGYVAAISGIVMAVCTLKGYEYLGKKLSGKGVAVSAVFMVIGTLLGNRLDWTIHIVRQLGMGVIEAFQAIPDMMADGVIKASAYYDNLMLVFLFVLVGAIPTSYRAIKDRKTGGRMRKLNS